MTISIELITAIGTAAVLIIGAVATASVKIITAIQLNNKITIAGQEAGMARGKVRDKKIQEIHVVTNSRLTAALRLILIMAKKEVSKINKDADKILYEDALHEVEEAEKATVKALTPDELNEDLMAALAAEEKLAKLTNNFKHIRHFIR